MRIRAHLPSLLTELFFVFSLGTALFIWLVLVSQYSNDFQPGPMAVSHLVLCFAIWVVAFPKTVFAAHPNRHVTALIALFALETIVAIFLGGVCKFNLTSCCPLFASHLILYGGTWTAVFRRNVHWALRCCVMALLVGWAGVAAYGWSTCL